MLSQEFCKMNRTFFKQKLQKLFYINIFVWGEGLLVFHKILHFFHTPNILFFRLKLHYLNVCLS